MMKYAADQGNINKVIKIDLAKRFLERLPKDMIVFAGISGSVSYDPQPEDDVDIFLVSAPGKMWNLLLRSFIVRRLGHFHEICLSLCMDTNFADKLFSEGMTPLRIRDTEHVIPLLGIQFYNMILETIHLHSADFHPQNGISITGSVRKGAGVFDLFLFIPLAAYQHIKALAVNRRMRTCGREDQCFTLRAGPGHFYLDTVKYRKLQERE